MAVPNLKKAQGNSASTTLSSGLANDGTSAPLTSDTNFAGEGMVVISEGENVEEYAYATTKGGGALTIPLVNRGLEGGSAQTHPSGAAVKGVLTADMWNDVIDHLNTQHNDDGTHKSALVTTLKATAAEVTTGTEDAKIVTPKALRDGTLTNQIITTPTLTLADATTMTTDGGILYDRTNEKLLIGDGTNTQAIQTGAWTTYVPNFTNVTKGSATVAFAYSVIGKTVCVRGSFVFAGDTSVSGLIGISLPVAAATANQEQTFIVRATDTGTNSYQVVAHMATNSRLDLYSLKTDGTYLSWLATSSTVPFTWTTNDAFMLNLTYQAA